VADFPAGVPSLGRPTPTTKTNAGSGLNLSTIVDKISDNVEALATKAGISESSAQDSPLADTVLASSTNTKSKWRKVATADIAAAAVTQNGLAVGTSGALSTSSGTFVDMTDMSVTLTTTGGDLLCWFEAVLFHSSASGAISVAIQLDSGSNDAQMTQQPSGVNEIPSPIATFTRFTGVSAGSHTVKGRWSTATGATANALGNNRRLMVVELKK
jgi:hypothetical protein